MGLGDQIEVQIRTIHKYSVHTRVLSSVNIPSHATLLPWMAGFSSRGQDFLTGQLISCSVNWFNSHQNLLQLKNLDSLATKGQR